MIYDQNRFRNRTPSPLKNVHFLAKSSNVGCKSKLDNYSLPSTLLPGNGDNRGSLQFRYFAGCEALHVLDSLCCKIVREMRNPEARHKAHTLHRTARSFTPVLDRCPHES
jgi:hypothetical protein